MLHKMTSAAWQDSRLQISCYMRHCKASEHLIISVLCTMVFVGKGTLSPKQQVPMDLLFICEHKTTKCHNTRWHSWVTVSKWSSLSETQQLCPFTLFLTFDYTCICSSTSQHFLLFFITSEWTINFTVWVIDSEDKTVACSLSTFYANHQLQPSDIIR